MLNSLFNNKSKFIWFLFHLLLGILATYTNLFIMIWFYFILFISLIKILRSKNIDYKNANILNLLFYLLPFEIIARMTKTSPIIPYEMGKYLTSFIFILGILINKNQKNSIGLIILVLLLPGILMGYLVETNIQYLIFNVLGMINIALGLIFIKGLRLANSSLIIENILTLSVLPILSSLICAIIKTPKYDEFEFSFEANSIVSGGFGSNQVSTAFGFAVFVLFYIWYKGKQFTGVSKFLDLLVMSLFLFQGLLTFSRGGIIVGIIGVLMVLLSKGLKGRIVKTLFLGIPIIFLSLFIANSLTNGKLLLRYQGESEGTLIGSKVKNINHMTSGRFDILVGDLEIFMENPILGVGVNQSRKIRNYSEGVVAHVEFSRLLAEHGLLGLIIFLILLYFLYEKWHYLKGDNSILLILFVIGLLTTFHAATRTFLSPLLIAFAYIRSKYILSINKVFNSA